MTRRRWLPWSILAVVLLLEFGLLLALILGGEALVDFLAYQRAADAIADGRSPYADPATAQEAWRAMHRVLIEGHEADEIIPGPYLYPPSLALLLDGTGLPQAVFLVLIVASVAAICMILLDASTAPEPRLVLAVALSADVLLTVSGGNAEIVLVALSVLGCRLFHLGRPGLAGLAAAVVLLVKPFFALLFVAFAVLRLGVAEGRPAVLRRTLLAAGTAALLVGLEALRWPGWLRSDFLTYMSAASDYTYLALPSEVQRPLSDWNRAPLQVLVTFGLPVGAAQAATLAIWAAVLGLSVGVLRHRLEFAPAFALAWVIFLFARPMTLTLSFFEFFALAALWPLAGRRERRLLGLGAGLLVASHWAALALTLLGVAPRLATLQTAALPWETVLVLPATFALLLVFLRRPPALAAPR
jgi:hypothetical protein